MLPQYQQHQQQRKSLPPLLNVLSFVWNIPRRTKLIAIGILLSLQLLLYYGMLRSRSFGWGTSSTSSNNCYHIYGIRDDPGLNRARCYIDTVKAKTAKIQSQITESHSQADFANHLSVLKANKYDSDIQQYDLSPFIYYHVGDCDTQAKVYKVIGDDEALLNMLSRRIQDVTKQDLITACKTFNE
jgi:hypothetical protein